MSTAAQDETASAEVNKLAREMLIGDANNKQGGVTVSPSSPVWKAPLVLPIHRF